MVRLIGADVDGTPGARYPLAWMLLAHPTTCISPCSLPDLNGDSHRIGKCERATPAGQRSAVAQLSSSLECPEKGLHRTHSLVCSCPRPWSFGQARRGQSQRGGSGGPAEWCNSKWSHPMTSLPCLTVVG